MSVVVSSPIPTVITYGILEGLELIQYERTVSLKTGISMKMNHFKWSNSKKGVTLKGHFEVNRLLTIALKMGHFKNGSIR